MKKSFFAVLFVLILVGLVFASGEADPDNEKYFEIWKQIFKERNNINNSYFNNHITIGDYGIRSEPGGDYFVITYYVNIDWAVVEMNEEQIIRPSVSLIRLDKEFVSQRSSNNYKKITTIDSLAFETYEDSLRFIKEETKKQEAIGYEYKYGVYDPKPWGNGNLYMNFQSKTGNNCSKGELNLYTKEIKFWDATCETFENIPQKEIEEEENESENKTIEIPIDCPLEWTGWIKKARNCELIQGGGCTIKYYESQDECFNESFNVIIMPSKANEIAIEKLGDLNFQIEIKEIESDKFFQVYELKAEKQGKIFGLFKKTGEVSIQISTDNEGIREVKKPGWAFLATGI
jgi:hypothetical protein